LVFFSLIPGAKSRQVGSLVLRADHSPRQVGRRIVIRTESWASVQGR